MFWKGQLSSYRMFEIIGVDKKQHFFFAECLCYNNNKNSNQLCIVSRRMLHYRVFISTQFFRRDHHVMHDIIATDINGQCVTYYYINTALACGKLWNSLLGSWLIGPNLRELTNDCNCYYFCTTLRGVRYNNLYFLFTRACSLKDDWRKNQDFICLFRLVLKRFKFISQFTKINYGWH